MRTVVFVACVAMLIGRAAAADLGLFESQSDVGSVSPAGTASYDAKAGSYTITSAGANLWARKDAFRFVWKKMSGDVALTAEIAWPPVAYGHEPNPHRKALLMVRQSLDEDSAYVDAAPHGNGLTALQYRPEKGANTWDIELNTAAPQIVRLEKRGDTFTMYLSLHGEPLHQVGASTKLHFEAPFYVGIGLTAHDAATTDKVVFRHVTLETPAPLPDKLVTYATLKTFKIDEGAPTATVIESKPGVYESPNWAPDSKSIVINDNGKFFRIPLLDPLAGGAREAFDTGTASGCWGEHGFSPDGKSYAVSCKAPGESGPDVQIVPAAGGAAQRLTHQPIAFFHGWSPDGKTIAFTSIRDGHVDVYTIPTAGGAAKKLTDTGLNDGAEFSGDGQFLYFNSNRSGSMQIWRMRPDGSGQEQVIHDDTDDWYPHISPDGQWMVFMSYAKGDGGMTGHPLNKDVVLRLRSLRDGTTRDLVKIVGGQGTMDSPNWSPDSKLIGFVSYQDLPAAAE
jgi:Tol biopolymer transport system component